MTASLLLLYIGAAVLLQAAAAAGIAIWRLRQTLPTTDLQVDEEPPASGHGAWPGWRRFRVEHRTFEDPGRTQCSFRLTPVDGQSLPPFRPGQFLTVRLPAAGASAPDQAAMITRCYSLSDRPAPDAYRITVKRVPAPPARPDWPPGLASAHWHDRVHEDDVIEIKAPAGQFFLAPDPAVPAVLICGGIGVTPMMSMLLWSLDAEPDREITLVHGVRNGQDQAFRSTLEGLAATHPHFHLHVVYSSPNPDDGQGRNDRHAGFVDIDLLRKILPRGRHDFYVCGPPPMMESLVPALRAWGVADSDIHFEAFGPASARPAPLASVLSTTAQLEIAFRCAGRTLAWDGRDASLLDLAERHGIVIETGCRTGSCGSCETKLLSGSVRYAHRPDHDIAAGCCLLCVGIPASAVLLDA